MESRLSALERWVSEQGKVVVELKADMEIIKESLPDMKEIKTMLLEIKKSKKSSEGGEYFVDDEEKKDEIYLHSSTSDDEAEALD